MDIDDEGMSILTVLNLKGLGAGRFWKLKDAFGSAAAVLSKPYDVLSKIVGPKAAGEIQQYQSQGQNSAVYQLINKELEALDGLNARLLFHYEDLYPPLLRQIDSAPPVLYVRGEVKALSLPQVAVVGSRNATPAGLENAWLFSRELAKSGIAINSGLALGIDGAAHKGALDVDGITVAVLGTGVDRIYPRGHQALAEQIVANGGAIVSEYPMGTQPHAGNFPRRNRVITGLSMGTLVVEAAIRSGSLISARLALEQDREVYAIPGSIHSPVSRGCHALIKQGAHLVESAADIINQLQGPLAYQAELAFTDEAQEPKDELAGVSESGVKVILAMGFDFCNLDQLSLTTNMGIGEISAELLQLELKGFVVQVDGRYQRVTGLNKNT